MVKSLDVICASQAGESITHPRAWRSIYHVVDDEPVTFGEFMAFTASAVGVDAPRSIPVPIARLVAGHNAVDAVVRSARSSNARIKRELGWSPRFPSFREGIPHALGVPIP